MKPPSTFMLPFSLGSFACIKNIGSKNSVTMRVKFKTMKNEIELLPAGMKSPPTCSSWLSLMCTMTRRYCPLFRASLEEFTWGGGEGARRYAREPGGKGRKSRVRRKVSQQAGLVPTLSSPWKVWMMKGSRAISPLITVCTSFGTCQE